MSEFRRPDGRVYRPRKPGLRAHAWENFGEACGVIVFGTLDPDAADDFARQSAAYWYGEGGLLYDPVPGWWRDGFGSHGRMWIADEKRGAPGVMFTWGMP